MSKLLNFRSVEEALLINILEGSGTEDNPYGVVKYVVIEGEVIGKVASLENE